jgi:hypothetical protein
MVTSLAGHGSESKKSTRSPIVRASALTWSRCGPDHGNSALTSSSNERSGGEKEEEEAHGLALGSIATQDRERTAEGARTWAVDSVGQVDDKDLLAGNEVGLEQTARADDVRAQHMSQAAERAWRD